MNRKYESDAQARPPLPLQYRSPQPGERSIWPFWLAHCIPWMFLAVVVCVVALWLVPEAQKLLGDFKVAVSAPTRLLLAGAGCLQQWHGAPALLLMAAAPLAAIPLSFIGAADPSPRRSIAAARWSRRLAVLVLLAVLAMVAVGLLLPIFSLMRALS